MLGEEVVICDSLVTHTPYQASGGEVGVVGDPMDLTSGLGGRDELAHDCSP